MQSFEGDNNTDKKGFSRMRDILFHQDAFAELNKESSKLGTYKIITGEIGLETYLTTE